MKVVPPTNEEILQKAIVKAQEPAVLGFRPRSFTDSDIERLRGLIQQFLHEGHLSEMEHWNMKALLLKCEVKTYQCPCESCKITRRDAAEARERRAWSQSINQQHGLKAG